MTELLALAVCHSKHLLAWSLALLGPEPFPRCDKQQSLGKRQPGISRGAITLFAESPFSKNMLWITGKGRLFAVTACLHHTQVSYSTTQHEHVAGLCGAPIGSPWLAKLSQGAPRAQSSRRDVWELPLGSIAPSNPSVSEAFAAVSLGNL